MQLPALDLAKILVRVILGKGDDNIPEILLFPEQFVLPLGNPIAMLGIGTGIALELPF